MLLILLLFAGVKSNAFSFALSDRRCSAINLDAVKGAIRSRNKSRQGNRIDDPRCYRSRLQSNPPHSHSSHPSLDNPQPILPSVRPSFLPSFQCLANPSLPEPTTVPNECLLSSPLLFSSFHPFSAVQCSCRPSECSVVRIKSTPSRQIAALPPARSCSSSAARSLSLSL